MMFEAVFGCCTLPTASNSHAKSFKMYPATPACFNRLNTVQEYRGILRLLQRWSPDLELMSEDKAETRHELMCTLSGIQYLLYSGLYFFAWWLRNFRRLYIPRTNFEMAFLLPRATTQLAGFNWHNHVLIGADVLLMGSGTTTSTAIRTILFRCWQKSIRFRMYVFYPMSDTAGKR